MAEEQPQPEAKSTEVHQEDQMRTKVKKKMFLQWWEKIQVVTAVCDKIGIDKKTFYKWIAKDKEFKRQILEGKAKINDAIEDILIAKAMIEKDGPSVRYYLDRKHPDYKPRMVQEVIAGERTLEDLLVEDAEERIKNESNHTNTDAGGSTQDAPEQGADRKDAPDSEQAGSAGTVQTEPSAEVLLGEKDAPKPDTESPAGGDQ